MRSLSFIYFHLTAAPGSTLFKIIVEKSVVELLMEVLMVPLDERQGIILLTGSGRKILTFCLGKAYIKTHSWESIL